MKRAPTPWGPFSQFHEETAWTPGENPGSRAVTPDIAPKWISADGRSFWLVWSDNEFKGDEGEDYNPDAAITDVVKNVHDDAEFIRAFADWTERYQPGAGFNTQRVDITLREETSAP